MTTTAGSICSACGELTPQGKFCIHCGATTQQACASCGAPVVAGAKFCLECGAALHGPAVAAAAAVVQQPVSERRLVSVLFADLVGFTALSEHRDPEEVRDLLSRYFDRCRTLIERYGGTVEKFIGDAVMAVWGTPVAREDDAERAVRAALALSHAVPQVGEEAGLGSLRIRAGVLTGHAAVELHGDGEAMVLGDTVNSASRLQSVAEPGRVLVDDVTRRASEAAIAYEDAGVHQVKGREQPLHAWTALRVVAGAGGARRAAGLEPLFVGREAELELVVESAEASAAQAKAVLVTVVGEAGSGKSRLLWEFFKYIDGIKERRWWHQGRCLSYGEGVGYWAIAEMVRARAGILEDEETTTARAKLSAAVAEYVPEERERRLVEPRLAHLLGLERRTATEAADLFSGWRLFFERMAQTSPVILAFEDLQYADSGLLDFIDYLLEWSAEFPIFILALGRPEVSERRRDWGTLISLDPLPPEAMQTLLDSAVPGLPGDLTARILERAEGIPLYAVEIVRMLLDRGVLTQEGSRYSVSATTADLDIPETLQALIAARLDNLDASERALLQDAAVLGMSFTPAALAAVSGRPLAEVDHTLGALVAKQLLGRDDDPRGGEQGQYHFLQALLRTIALSTLSRRDRKARHLAAAQHLRDTWSEPTDIAEVLASHYLAAVDADPEAKDADAIRASARETLEVAGQRAVSLALGAEARQYFEQAAALAADEAEKARLLAEAGAAAARSGDHEAARALLGDAIGVLDASGQTDAAARTRAQLARVLIDENRLKEAGQLIDEAREAARDEEVLAELAGRRAAIAFLTGDPARAREEADVALAIADPRDLGRVMTEAVQTKACALCYEHRQTEANALMSLGLELALELDFTEAALRAYFNLAEYRLISGDHLASANLLDQGLALARERGNRVWERDLLAQRVGVHAFAGEWDEALALIEAIGAGGDDDSARLANTYVPLIAVARGDMAAVQGCLAQPSRSSEWYELALMESVGRAVALRACGRLDEVTPTFEGAASTLATVGGVTYLFYLGEVFDALLEAGSVELLEQLLVAPAPLGLPLLRGELDRLRGNLCARQGAVSEAEGLFGRAVDGLRAANNPFALARALLGHGTALTDAGAEERATAALREARLLFERLRATPWIERAAQALLPVAA